jgi:hypothetical protein
MSIGRSEVLAAARRLLRTLASAPDPKRHARSIYSELAHGQGWSHAEQDKIDALGAWLQGTPSLGDLRPRCEKILADLAQH